jgi:hypothetical protein
MKMLRDRGADVSSRTTAAGLAGNTVVMDEDMAELLLSIVQNAAEPDELRGAAAISLGPALEETEMEGFDDDFSDPLLDIETFDRILQGLRQTHLDPRVSKLVRRRVLEASVRAPQDWHEGAIRAALASGDEDWKLTAAFCMKWIRGFDSQIIEMLGSRNPGIHYEAVCAAGNWELDGAWEHVATLLTAKRIEKRLLLAAIGAAGSIRPEEARPILEELAGSEDAEIAEAADEAMLMARPDFDDFEDEDEDEESRR